MPTTVEMTAFDRGVRPVAQIVFPEKARAVLAFRPDPEIQERIEELAEKSTEGRLSEAERAERKGFDYSLGHFGRWQYREGCVGRVSHGMGHFGS